MLPVPNPRISYPINCYTRNKLSQRKIAAKVYRYLLPVSTISIINDPLIATSTRTSVFNYSAWRNYGDDRSNETRVTRSRSIQRETNRFPGFKPRFDGKVGRRFRVYQPFTGYNNISNVPKPNLALSEKNFSRYFAEVYFNRGWSKGGCFPNTTFPVANITLNRRGVD